VTVYGHSGSCGRIASCRLAFAKSQTYRFSNEAVLAAEQTKTWLDVRAATLARDRPGSGDAVPASSTHAEADLHAALLAVARAVALAHRKAPHRALTGATVRSE
jgi:hypothetical protein